MEQRSVSDIIKHFQPLLKKFEKDDKLQLSHAEEELGSRPGENYMSVVIRTRVEGKRGDGTPYKKSFMRKELLPHPKVIEISRGYELFQNEAYCYQKILPLFGPFGPDCVLADPKQIIMEDLRQRGYILNEKRKMLDFNHCKSVMQTLAALHAASMSMKLKDPQGFQKLISPIKEVVFPTDSKPSIGQYVVSGMYFALKSLESIEPRTERVQKLIDFVQPLSVGDKAYTTVQKLCTPREDKYQVINHGDLWNNNILFLSDKGGRILRVKFVDYQITRYTSVAADLCYFFYSSANAETIENHFEDLLKIYHDYLIHELRMRDVPEGDLENLPFSWLKSEMKKYGLTGFIMGLMVMQAIFMDEKQATELNMEKGVEEGWDVPSDKVFETLPLTPEKTERVRCVIGHFVENVL